jgi:hypothetical protein
MFFEKLSKMPQAKDFKRRLLSVKILQMFLIKQNKKFLHMCSKAVCCRLWSTDVVNEIKNSFFKVKQQ